MAFSAPEGRTTVVNDAPAPGANRTRTVLLVAVVVLILLLGGLVYLFFTLLQPSGLPDQLNRPVEREMQWVRSLYGFGPSADEQLLSPSSVAIAPNGDTYATDPTRARIMVFRPDGTFKELIHTGAGGVERGQFVRPESIDIDASGNIYIADSWANKIVVLDSTGRFVTEWPVDQQARGVYVDDGKVYVLDVGKIIIFDTQGTRLSSFGVRGNKTGQIDAYQGVTAADGKVFLADSFNKRMQSFDESGAVLWAIPSGDAPRSGPASRTASGSDESSSAAVPDHRWDLPQDLVFDGRGRLVVVDAFQFEMAVVDPETGKVDATYGAFGREDGQFFYPTSIDYDPVRDWFAIADTNNNRVQIVRIPASGGGLAESVWRLASSPYRYLAIPAALALIALVLSLWAGRRVMRRSMQAAQEVTHEVSA